MSAGGTRGRIIILSGLLVTLAGWLVWPMAGSPSWDIHPDAVLADGKRAYLTAVGRAESGATPNVLLILADDLGRHDVGFMGGPATPNIDALAGVSTVYPNAYATASICAPSRAALLTGRLQNRYGFESQPMQRYVRNVGEYLGFRYLIDTDDMQPFLLDSYPSDSQKALQGLPPSEITLAEVFQALGYRTGLFGKWHLGYGEQNHPLQFGFDEQYGFLEAFSLYAEEDSPDVVEYRHDLFWEKHIWSMGRSGPSGITRNGTMIEEERYLTDAILEETLAFIDASIAADRPFFAFVPFSAPHTPFQARVEDFEATTESDDRNRRVYLAMIRRLDHAVGQLISFLETRGVNDRTIVVFTSDNGAATYTGATTSDPLRGGKFTQFEGGLAVPLILRNPSIDPGVDNRLVMLTDLYATLLEASGAPPAADRAYDSLSLFKPADAGRKLYWRSDFNRALRHGRWKLVEDTRAGLVQLYDLEADPGETKNLAASNTALVEKLRSTLDHWELEMASPGWPRVMNYRYQDELGEYWFAI